MSVFHATHVDTLSIQDHLKAGRVAAAAQMCRDVALAEYDLPAGTYLPIPPEWEHKVPYVPPVEEFVPEPPRPVSVAVGLGRESTMGVAVGRGHRGEGYVTTAPWPYAVDPEGGVFVEPADMEYVPRGMLWKWWKR